MTASPPSSASSSIPPALRAFLRDGLVSDGGGGSSTSASTTTAVRESDVLLALQQVTKQVQAGEVDEVREELLPLLATGNSSSGRGAGGAAAFAPLWKSVFEIKAKEPSGFSQSEGVQIKVRSARRPISPIAINF